MIRTKRSTGLKNAIEEEDDTHSHQTYHHVETEDEDGTQSTTDTQAMSSQSHTLPERLSHAPEMPGSDSTIRDGDVNMEQPDDRQSTPESDTMQSIGRKHFSKPSTVCTLLTYCRPQQGSYPDDRQLGLTGHQNRTPVAA